MQGVDCSGRKKKTNMPATTRKAKTVPRSTRGLSDAACPDESPPDAFRRRSAVAVNSNCPVHALPVRLRHLGDPEHS